MKNARWLLPGLALAALALSGCWLVSGQFAVSVDLPDPLPIASATTIVASQIDLTTESTYNDHKEDLKGLADCAILGTFSNPNSPTPSPGAVDVVVYMTPATTNHQTPSELAGDATKLQVWGPFKLAVGESKTIGWDHSAALFGKAGKAALLAEVKGDGKFTLYAVGTTVPYAFRVDKGVAVVVIDAGK